MKTLVNLNLPPFLGRVKLETSSLCYSYPLYQYLENEVQLASGYYSNIFSPSPPSLHKSRYLEVLWCSRNHRLRSYKRTWKLVYLILLCKFLGWWRGGHPFITFLSIFDLLTAQGVNMPYGVSLTQRVLHTLSLENNLYWWTYFFSINFILSPHFYLTHCKSKLSVWLKCCIYLSYFLFIQS